MVETSTLREVLIFFDKIGIYDVVLPFLLVFTIVFAILEKTKVFGTEDIEGKKFTKKNLNSMTAFVIAFFVVASSKLVETITQVSSYVVLLLLLSVFFLLLVGSFMKEEKDGVALDKPLNILFMIIMFIGIVLIFLQAIKVESGESWLEWAWNNLSEHWTSTGIASVILVIVIVLFMLYITKSPSEGKKSEEKK